MAARQQLQKCALALRRQLQEEAKVSGVPAWVVRRRARGGQQARAEREAQRFCPACVTRQYPGE
eukprot:1335914-Alexandrium_andersonii.AAC.1